MRHELCPMRFVPTSLSVNYPANVMNAITTPMIGNASTKPIPNEHDTH